MSNRGYCECGCGQKTRLRTRGCPKRNHVIGEPSRFIRGHVVRIFKLKGRNHPNWKGDQAKYCAIHDWVRRVFGKPEFCEDCGTKKSQLYHWANISGEYKRRRTDWKRLCVPCHKIFDNNKRRKTWTKKTNSH